MLITNNPEKVYIFWLFICNILDLTKETCNKYIYKI